MEMYFFNGIVFPERAQLSLKRKFQFKHLTSGKTGIADMSVILNQVAVWVETEKDWEIYDLRNVVQAILGNELAVVGFLKGFAYDLDLRRVINRDRGIDYVFGIGIPCLEERNKDVNVIDALLDILHKSQGPEGIFLHRCFGDLKMAIKMPDDTGFYCYRAIESLRLHCAAKYNIVKTNKTAQWNKFWEIVAGQKDEIALIKETADPTRHGVVVPLTSDDRANLFMRTWDIVDRYLSNL